MIFNIKTLDGREPGSKLFGIPVDARRRHSLASLSRSTRVHQATLRRALKLTGVLHADVDADYRFTVDAGQGEKLAYRIRNSIPISKIPDYLNCNRTQAQMLVKRGFVSQLVPGLGRGGGVLTKVALGDLDDFISRYRANGIPVCQAGDGMIDAITASEVVKIPVMDIVQLVLDCKLTSVELLPEKLGFRSVLISAGSPLGCLAGRMQDRFIRTRCCRPARDLPIWCHASSDEIRQIGPSVSTADRNRELKWHCSTSFRGERGETVPGRLCDAFGPRQGEGPECKGNREGVAKP